MIAAATQVDDGLVRGFWSKAECVQWNASLFVQANFVWEDRRGKQLDIPVTVLQVDVEHRAYYDTTFRALQHYQGFVRAAGNEAFLLGPLGIKYESKFLKDMVVGNLCGRWSWLYFEAFSPWRVAPVPEAVVFLAGDGSYVCPTLKSVARWPA